MNCAMRISVTLSDDDVTNLARVMAAMDPRAPDGKLRPITPTDAVREALRVAFVGGASVR